ncbi:MAG: sodium:proton antiporter [Holosporales bacterium]|nr:sodium:proton antiporter [Holosporales bacterium]
MSIFEIIILSLPLVVVLLSIAFMPLITPKFWRKYETIWLLIISVVSIISTYKIIPSANQIIKHSLLDDYLPFIIMVFTVYVLSSGIRIQMTSSACSIANIVFLVCGGFLASFIGTTGASVLLLPPFLEMNKNRVHKTHLIVFFIFLVANIGGMLTPLGDPPIFFGYLHGVDFSWPLINLFPYWLGYTVSCLCILYVIDKVMLKKEESLAFLEKQKFSIKINGWLDIILLALTVFVLFVDFECEINICGLSVSSVFIRNLTLLIFAGTSICSRGKNSINLTPCAEVAKIFLAIFIVITPVLFILNENTETIRAYVESVSRGSSSVPLYFWFGAITSSFLDNTPSYLLFFNIAGGNAQSLMHAYPNILTAISVSTVVMGAMTYIGNAPNLMIRSIAEGKGIKMPSFIGYMALSCLIILPISFVAALLMR